MVSTSVASMEKTQSGNGLGEYGLRQQWQLQSTRSDYVQRITPYWLPGSKVTTVIAVRQEITSRCKRTIFG